MKKRTAFRGLVIVVCFVVPILADQKPPVLVFGGNRFYVGMSQHEALTALADCCTLSPPLEAGVEKREAPPGQILGHFIVAKDGSPFHILGSISFRYGKVFRLTRPLADDVDTSSDDVVGFVRALKRSLPTEATDSEVIVHVSVRHERMSNAESDVVFLTYPNGRGIELHIGTLDKPGTGMNTRDFVTMDEVLEYTGF
jgi:hypothetical protein